MVLVVVISVLVFFVGMRAYGTFFNTINVLPTASPCIATEEPAETMGPEATYEAPIALTQTSTDSSVILKSEGAANSTLVNFNGFVDVPKEGNIWLVINVTITNNGYSSFNTDPYYFSVIINNVKHTYDQETDFFGYWTISDIPNGGSYNGLIVYQVPQSASSYGLIYERPNTNYNIVYG